MSSALLVVLGLVLAPLASAGKSPRVKSGVIHACMKTKGKKPSAGRSSRHLGQAVQEEEGRKALTWGLAGRTPGPAAPARPGGAQVGANGDRGGAGARATPVPTRRRKG